MTEVIYLDIESTIKGDFLVACLSSGEVFYTSLDLYKYVRKYEGVIYAHAGGSFDFLFILQHVNKSDDLHLILRGSNIYKMRLNKCILIDTIYIAPISLETWGSVWNIKKSFIDYDNILDYKMEDLIDKCMQHAIMLKDCHCNLYKFFNIPLYSVNTIGMVALKIISSYGFDIQKKWYKPNNVLKGFYSGGRTEIYKMKANNVNIYDINSSYPYSMSNWNIYDNYMIKEKVSSENNVVGVYGIFNQDRYIPIIPVKRDKIYYPNGLFKAFLCMPEFRLLKDNEIKKVLWYVVGMGEQFSFKRFVDDFYNKKKQKDKFEVLYKLILNASYGKFVESEKKEFLSNKKYNEQSKRRDYIKTMWENTFYYEIPYSDVMFASLITSNSRALLYNYMEQCGFENVIYCDTDSIFTTKELSTGDKLGELKCEGKNGYFEALQPKIYKYISKDKVKVKAKGFAGINEELFNMLAKGYKIEIEEYTKAKTVMKKGKFERVKIDKCIREIYKKRKVIDKINTEPLNIIELRTIDEKQQKIKI